MLEVLGLRKSFEGRSVLSGVDLTVAAGECVALLGGNGSGKTTLLRCVAGLVRPDAGSIRVHTIDSVADGRRSRRHLSFLPQKPVFPLTLTVKETLEVTAQLRWISNSRVERELEECGLAALANRSVSVLSGGERQRLGLAVAFLPEVELYLFDEPSANLDPRALAIFHERAKRLVDDGRAVLFTTHTAADVESLAKRVEVLLNGQLHEEGPLREPISFSRAAKLRAVRP